MFYSDDIVHKRCLVSCYFPLMSFTVFPLLLRLSIPDFHLVSDVSMEYHLYTVICLVRVKWSGVQIHGSSFLSDMVNYLAL